MTFGFSIGRRESACPCGPEGANLLPGSALLDGRAVELGMGSRRFCRGVRGGRTGQLSPRAFAAADDARRGRTTRIRSVDSSCNGFARRIDAAGRRPAGRSAFGVRRSVSGKAIRRDCSPNLGPADRLAVRWQETTAPSGARLAVNAEQLIWLKIQPGSVVVAAKFRLHVAEGELRQVQLAVDPRLRLLPFSGETSPAVQVVAESGQTRLINLRWPRPITDETVLETAFLFSETSAVGKIRLPRIELVDTQSTRRWMAVSVDPALDSDEQKDERLEPLAVADFLNAWGQSDSKPKAAYRLPRGETGWTLSTRPHEPHTAADQTLSLGFDEDRIDARFEARLAVASGYAFQHQVTAPEDFKIERISVVAGDADRLQRWSRDEDGGITLFLDGPASGTERLSIRGRLAGSSRGEVRVAAVRRSEVSNSLGDHSAVRASRRVVAIPERGCLARSGQSGRDARALNLARRRTFGRLVETIAWDGLRRPPVTIIAEANHNKTDAPHRATNSQDDAKPARASGRKSQGKAAPTPVFVRLADVAVAWQTNRRWCGVAALDIEPGGAKELELRLPADCELVQAYVEDMPAVTTDSAGGPWRIALASCDSPQQIVVVYRCLSPATDDTGRLRFALPTLGQAAGSNLPVRRTLWTLFLPPTLTVESPQGAVPVEHRPGNLRWPDGFAAVSGMLPPRYYLSKGGCNAIAIGLLPARSHWPFHRWAAAVVLVLCGTVSAGGLARARRKTAGK